MLTVITDPEDIARAQARFSALLRQALTTRIACVVSGAGGSYETEVAYSPALAFWYAYRAEKSRHWNGSGKGEPQAGRKVAISSEINFPLAGLNRATAGVFARADDGQIAVLHRGKIRGGKALFFAHFSGRTVDALDGDKTDRFACVGDLDSPEFAAQIAAFVAQVLRIKAAG